MTALRSLLLALFVTCAWIAAPLRAEDGALETIRKTGSLRIGVTGDYLPYSFRDAGGRLSGADVEMGKDLAATLGVRAEFVPTTWKTLLDDFKAGKFDILAGGVTVTPERAEAGDFSISPDHDGKRPIVRCADKDKFVSIEVIDRPGVRVVVNPGGTNERFARDHFQRADIALWPDNRTIFERIAGNEADVMVTDGIEVTLQSVRHPGVLCPAAVAEPFTHFDKAYLLRRDPALKRAVDEWMEEAIASGKWQAYLKAAMQ